MTTDTLPLSTDYADLPKEQWPEVMTRREAKEKGLKKYFLGEACVHGHIARRSVKDSKCLRCGLGRGTRHYQRNKKRIDANHALYQKEHPEGSRRRSKAYREAHPEKCKASAAAYRENNPDKIAAFSFRTRNGFLPSPELAAALGANLLIKRELLKPKS